MMPLEAHLDELRRRLFWILLLYLPVTAVLFFNAQWVTGLLLLASRGRLHHLVYLSPTEVVFTYLKVAMVGALVAVSPFIAYQLGAFVWPGLTAEERRFGVTYIPSAVLLFWAGAAFGYFFFVPVVLRFVLAFGGPGLAPMISYAQYVGFVLNLILPFALVFEFPMVVLVLTGLGILSPAWLRRNRRWAVFVIFVIAAALAPPDLGSMLVMVAPMLVLYEVGIWVATIAEKRRARRETDEGGRRGDGADRGTEPPPDGDRRPPA